MFVRKTQLAWRNLTHSWRRLAIALAGINFAVLLMFIEIGFQNAMFDSTVKMLRELNADIIITSKANYAQIAKQMFDRQRLYQARGCPGVADVSPLYIETFYAIWKRPHEKTSTIRVLAFDLDDPVFNFARNNATWESLAAPETALIDVKSKAKYGVPNSKQELIEFSQQGAELSGKSIRLVGTFSLGTDFANDGNLIMSAANFAEYFPNRVIGDDPLSIVDLGLVRVEPGADPEVVAQRLRSMLPGDVMVQTKAAMVGSEMQYWNNSTPIGFIFTMGTIMGFVVGVIICYQIIYTDIADHMAEFATLKAMGYSNRYFIRVVIQQSLYLSILGFIPGVLISYGLYWVLAETTGLLMLLNLSRAAVVLVLTMAMCVVSGCLAMRKLISADPAELF